MALRYTLLGLFRLPARVYAILVSFVQSARHVLGLASLFAQRIE